MDAKYFRKFLERLGLVDKIRVKHSSRLEWTLTSRGASGQLFSHLDQVLEESIKIFLGVRVMSRLRIITRDLSVSQLKSIGRKLGYMVTGN